MARILFISYEHVVGTFSGNGVYAQQQTAALQRLGHHVVVVSAYSDALELNDDEEKALRVPVPSASWGTLHNDCAWKEFSDGVVDTSLLQRLLDPTTERLRFDIVFTVDWHAALAWKRICESIKHDCSTCTPLWVFLSYRMFSRDESAGEVIREAEKWAASKAHQTITLSKSDQSFVHESGWIPKSQACPFLPPGIRADAAAIPFPSDATNGQWPSPDRKVFLCCVRISPEKQPRTFVSIAAALSQQGVFKRFGLEPVLLAASSSSYAQEIVHEFEEKVPEGSVERRFMNASELAGLFARTAMNVHPCIYDAYGMTVVEAASQGAPSIMHAVCLELGHLSDVSVGDTVGATHILCPTRGESFACDLTAPADDVARQIEAILEDSEQCSRVAKCAAAAAQNYDSVANAKQLMSLVQKHAPAGSSTCE